jgi:hypothetical protein
MMYPVVFRPRYEGEIVKIIIQGIAVDMMNDAVTPFKAESWLGDRPVCLHPNCPGAENPAVIDSHLGAPA